MPNPLACLADDLAPAGRAAVLMETFHAVSQGLPAVQALLARRTVIETIAGDVAVFYKAWEEKNPGWPAEKILPEGGHTFGRLAWAFAKASPLECRWLFHALREKACPAYASPNLPKLELSKKFEEKINCLVSQIPNSGIEEDLTVPSRAFRNSISPGIRYALHASAFPGLKHLEETVASLAECNDWEGAWKALWEELADMFGVAMEKMAQTPKEEREWSVALDEAVRITRNFWGSMEGVLRHIPGPREALARMTVEKIVDEITHAYEPDNVDLFQTLAVWEISCKMARARFASRQEAMGEAWNAVAPMMEKAGFDWQDFRETLIGFKEWRHSGPSRPQGENEAGFRVWEARMLQARFSETFEVAPAPPVRRRGL